MQFPYHGSMDSMIKRLLVSFILGFGAIIILYLLYIVLPQTFVKSITPESAEKMAFFAPEKTFSQLVSSPSPSPSPSPALTPVTIIIPKLNIQTAIEQVGLTETNNMDTPKNADNVGWYQYGSKPGEEGNAVIAGHYDTPTGKPAVFYTLKKLEEGDEVEVISENGVHSIFVVVEKSSIPYDVFPSEQVFVTRPGRNLNLITCGGVWDIAKKTYTNRIVVYTTLKEVKNL